jgi:hypothetical protein
LHRRLLGVSIGTFPNSKNQILNKSKKEVPQTNSALTDAKSQIDPQTAQGKSTLTDAKSHVDKQTAKGNSILTDAKSQIDPQTKQNKP